MNEEKLLIKLQVDSLTKQILSNKQVCPFQVFSLRNELRLSCKESNQASKYLEQIIVEEEIALNNILNFYQHK